MGNGITGSNSAETRHPRDPPVVHLQGIGSINGWPRRPAAAASNALPLAASNPVPHLQLLAAGLGSGRIAEGDCGFLASALGGEVRAAAGRRRQIHPNADQEFV
jgi:hypothetical protein